MLSWLEIIWKSVNGLVPLFVPSVTKMRLQNTCSLSVLTLRWFGGLWEVFGELSHFFMAKCSLVSLLLSLWEEIPHATPCYNLVWHLECQEQDNFWWSCCSFSLGNDPRFALSYNIGQGYMDPKTKGRSRMGRIKSCSGHRLFILMLRWRRGLQGQDRGSWCSRMEVLEASLFVAMSVPVAVRWCTYIPGVFCGHGGLELSSVG
jgi:uncharacterized protein YjeT (DUF2065 family)